MKMFYVLVLGLVLAGCGGEGSPTAAKPVGAAQLCPESMGITAEKLFSNMDAGLKATNAPVNILDKSVTPNECGYQVQMVTGFGAVFIQLNPQQEVLSLGAGYDNSSNLADNTRNLFAVIQTVVSTNGTAKLGETEIGKTLFSAAADTVLAAKESGSASKDLTYGGNLYTVTVEGKTVAMLTRKQF